jgi:stearoyl-CoA desaturase (delta-9 desaturase)
MANDKWMVLQNRYYGLIAVAVGFGIPVLIGWSVGDVWGGLLYGGLLRVIVTHHCTFFINSLCHMWGFRPYDPHSSARDNFFLAFLTFGEGYHNFHHYFQADYRNGIRWYHWDPTKWLVGSLASMGLAYRLKRTADQEILRARLDAEANDLIQKGAPSESLLLLRQKIEDAQIKFREVKAEYEKLKSQAREHSRIYVAQKRFELKAAHKDFKHARAQWSDYIRALRPVLSTNS